MSIDPRDKFFPTAPTLADYDAAVKRAEAAEDHLAREVASSQALQLEAIARDAVITDLLARIDGLNTVITESNDHLDEAFRNFRVTLAERDATLESWSLAKARDGEFISGLRDRVATRDDALSEMAVQLDDARGANGILASAVKDRDITIANLLATLVARDAQIDDMRGQIATLAVQVDAYDAAAEALVDNQ